jgi:hypothetical protein
LLRQKKWLKSHLKLLSLKKKIGAETIKGDPDVLTVASRSGPTKLLKRQPNLQHCRYRSETWISRRMDKFTHMLVKLSCSEEEGLRGKVYVTLW